MKIDIKYSEKGNGIPFVMLPSVVGGEDYFKYQFEKFSNEYRVISFQITKISFEDNNTNGVSFEIADKLYDFLIQKKITKVILMGHLDGARIALIFAKKHPEMVKKLILNSIFLSSDGFKEIGKKKLNIKESVSDINNIEDDSQILSTAFELFSKEPEIDDGILREITSPTLIVEATRNEVSNVHIKHIAKNIPNCKLCFLKGGYLLALRRFGEFNFEVSKFLNEA